MRRPGSGAVLAVLLALAATSCKDEKVRIPLTVPLVATVVTGPTPVFFTVADRADATVRVFVELSTDGGATFRAATPAAGSPSIDQLAARPEGVSSFFFWDPLPDLGPGVHRDVVLRVYAHGRELGPASDTGALLVDLSDRLEALAAGAALDLVEPLAAPLPDGTVWVAGGRGAASATPSALGFRFDPRDGALQAVAGLLRPRLGAGVAATRGGAVLVAGGTEAGAPSAFAETLRLAAGAPLVEAVPGGLAVARSGPAVAGLRDGRAVVLGGVAASGPTPVVEVWSSGGFQTALTSPLAARTGATATALPDGRVLLAGGFDAAGNPVLSAALLDAQASTLAAAGPSTQARGEHAAVLLSDGRVFLAGGTARAGDDGAALGTADVFDPATGGYQALPNMRRPRRRPGIAYAHGQVLVVGGTGASDGPQTAERFDLARGTWSDVAGPTGTPRPDAAVVNVAGGEALVVGGGGRAERYTFAAALTAQAFDQVVARPEPRADHTAARLLDGSVLLAGGTALVQSALATCERFDPLTRTFSARASLTRARAGHCAALTFDGELFVAGGRDAAGLVAQAEVYDPVNDRWTATGALSVPRERATATVLRDGRVLVAGGTDALGLPVAQLEVWEPRTGTFATGGALDEARAGHQALEANGEAVLGPGAGAAAGVVDVVAPFTVVRRRVAVGARAGAALAFSSLDGRLLLLGGSGADGPRADVGFVDLFAGAALAATRPLVRARASPAAVALPNQEVLVLGGTNALGGLVDEAEVYRFTGVPAEGGAARATLDPRQVKARARATATPLTDGRVLVVGGVDERGVVVGGAELFLP